MSVSEWKKRYVILGVDIVNEFEVAPADVVIGGNLVEVNGHEIFKGGQRVVEEFEVDVR
jgi:hypothetical protein